MASKTVAHFGNPFGDTVGERAQNLFTDAPKAVFYVQIQLSMH